jgi:hypothetical protein
LTLFDILVLLFSNQSLNVAKAPVTFNLDISPVYIAVEAPSDCIDVEISPGVAVLIEHKVAGVAHIHEVLTCVRG